MASLDIHVFSDSMDRVVSWDLWMRGMPGDDLWMLGDDIPNALNGLIMRISNIKTNSELANFFFI